LNVVHKPSNTSQRYSTASYVFPRQALQMEKRYMRRYMRKPPKLKMREYMSRVEELNNNLQYFPAFC
jgi:hypothetical protein